MYYGNKVRTAKGTRSEGLYEGLVEGHLWPDITGAYRVGREGVDGRVGGGGEVRRGACLIFCTMVHHLMCFIFVLFIISREFYR